LPTFSFFFPSLLLSNPKCKIVWVLLILERGRQMLKRKAPISVVLLDGKECQSPRVMINKAQKVGLQDLPVDSL
jgi:hypothetical protein